MKKTIAFILITTFSLGNAHVHHNTVLHRIKFTNPVMKILDGVRFAFDGYNIGDMIFVIKKVKELAYGKLDRLTGTRTGTYTYDNDTYSIRALAEIEAEIGTTDTQLRKLFDQAMKDFISITEPYIEKARGTEEYTQVLVNEWMEKTGRDDSQLSNWNNAKAGEEVTEFKKSITNFKELYAFLEDLIGYLESLVHSCPKGCKQFKELVAKRQA